MPKDQIPEGYYLTVKKPSQPIPGEEVVFLYALLDINIENELDSSMLDCQRKLFAGKKERYDAQYAEMATLVVGN